MKKGHGYTIHEKIAANVGRKEAMKEAPSRGKDIRMWRFNTINGRKTEPLRFDLASTMCPFNF